MKPLFPTLFRSLSSGERRILRNLSIAAAAFLLICFVVQLVNGRPDTSVEIVEAPPAPTSGLESQNHFVFRPRFQTIDGEFSAGSAFVTMTPFSDKPIVLTALHLLGPSGGYYRQVDSNALRTTFTGLSLREMFTDQLMNDFSVSALEIPDARPVGSPSLAGDVAAFRIEKNNGVPIEPAPLASGNTPISIGSTLHLVYRMEDREARLHEAEIIEERDGMLVYAFRDAKVSLRGAAGAPLLNEAGEVAAIHLGGGEQDGRPYGLATPVTRFRSRLEVACRAPIQVTQEARATASATPSQAP